MQKTRLHANWLIAPIILCFLSSIGFGALAVAQTEGDAQKTDKPPENNRTKKIIPVKYADVDQLANVLRGLGFYVQGNRELRVISISGSSADIIAMEDAIKRLDVIPPLAENIELTAYLLVASEQPGAKNTPGELDGVIKQLKGVFSYQGYRLMDTLMVRCRNGREGEVNGVAPSNSDDFNKPLYQLRFRSVTLIPDSTGKKIRIDGLRLGAKMPFRQGANQFTYIDTGINTDIDVREGQKVVVGKATVDSSNNALFLVLTARVVE